MLLINNNNNNMVNSSSSNLYCDYYLAGIMQNTCSIVSGVPVPLGDSSLLVMSGCTEYMQHCLWCPCPSQGQLVVGNEWLHSAQAGGLSSAQLPLSSEPLVAAHSDTLDSRQVLTRFQKLSSYCPAVFLYSGIESPFRKKLNEQVRPLTRHTCVQPGPS